MVFTNQPPWTPSRAFILEKFNVKPLIFLIDEMEYQEVSTVDITREFMQEDTNAPQNYHNDPQNDPIIKIKNTNDATE